LGEFLGDGWRTTRTLLQGFLDRPRSRERPITALGFFSWGVRDSLEYLTCRPITCRIDTTIPHPVSRNFGRTPEMPLVACCRTGSANASSVFVALQQCGYFDRLPQLSTPSCTTRNGTSQVGRERCCRYRYVPARSGQRASNAVLNALMPSRHVDRGGLLCISASAKIK
jgi:hypothetical protein